MKWMKLILAIILFSYFPAMPIQACTTAIISGKNTPDGRPILLKHRDTSFLQNKLMYFRDGKYEYIGLVNSEDSVGNEIWAGCNQTGFAIMNSQSYNLNINDTTSLKDKEGVIMKRALQTCASIDDFDELLRTLPKPLGVESNFGVIDALGGAAYFETSNFDFVKIDANNPITAPFGYLIRTNYSFSRTEQTGYGYIRYFTVEELFYQASAVNNLTHRFLLQDISRCLKHSLTKSDLIKEIPDNSLSAKFVFFRDYIPRFSSASTVVIQGVKSDESPLFTTMWTILGFQLCSVAVPTWVIAGENLPQVLAADKNGTAPLCDMALTLKNQCFPVQRGSGETYLNLSALLNKEGTGILQMLLPLEMDILRETNERMLYWREKGMDIQEIQQYYRSLDEKILDHYHNILGL
jgi:hypothetical protein